MRKLIATSLVAGLLALVPVGAASAQVDPAPTQETVWLCRPGLADNPCETDLTTTVYDEDGEVLGVRTPRVNRRSSIDCFYVYPTTSDDPGGVSDLSVDDELQSIALYQAARFSSECRVFAPVYRQRTIGAIGGAAVTPAQQEQAYQDVRLAFLEYLAEDNGGRGVVFIGHSQGAGVLRRLIREEVDPDPAARAQLVSALLLGSNTTVARGSDRGGDFANIPTCQRRTQTGCVIGFVTFGGPVPPNSRFGRTADPSRQVVCTNPADLRGGSSRVRTIFPTEPFAPGTIAAVNGLLGLPAVTATTPWIEYRGAYEAECSSADGADVLQVSPRGALPQPNPSPDATWGLHLLDANIALGDLVDLVGRQGRVWSARAGRSL